MNEPSVGNHDIADEGPEALEWLTRLPDPRGIVWDGVLEPPSSVAALVCELTALGCRRVFMPTAFLRKVGDADVSYGLGVHLPATTEARWAVLDLLAERAGRAGQMLPSSAWHYAEHGGVILVAYIE